MKTCFDLLEILALIELPILAIAAAEYIYLSILRCWEDFLD